MLRRFLVYITVLLGEKVKKFFVVGLLSLGLFLPSVEFSQTGEVEFRAGQEAQARSSGGRSRGGSFKSRTQTRSPSSNGTGVSNTRKDYTRPNYSGSGPASSTPSVTATPKAVVSPKPLTPSTTLPAPTGGLAPTKVQNAPGVTVNSGKPVVRIPKGSVQAKGLNGESVYIPKGVVTRPAYANSPRTQVFGGVTHFRVQQGTTWVFVPQTPSIVVVPIGGVAHYDDDDDSNNYYPTGTIYAQPVPMQQPAQVAPVIVHEQQGQNWLAIFLILVAGGIAAFFFLRWWSNRNKY